ncbi:hypothetical protein DPMN_006336 [Dreissena polymorpha]|uniref:Uncharacterized protein n=1 Tax=Dreissena polymorpha TaxID=45954 RepID=A0A9D4MTX6_DREPO|nr:hypothetical protein DPMN_006336 [Dreissena polymorpha]
MKTAAPTSGHFYEDWTINCDRLTDRWSDGQTDTQSENHKSPPVNPVGDNKTNAPYLGSHIYKQTGTIFKLCHHIIRKNVLTKFDDDLTKSVTSRGYNFNLRKLNINLRKTAPPPCKQLKQGIF